MTRLILARHGNTFAAGEPPRRIGAATDLPLTAEGEAQAQALGAHLAGRGFRFGMVLAGGLLRQRETARLILSAMRQDAAIAHAPWLDEIDHGPDENKPEAEVEARIGGAALRRWDEAGEAPAGWIVDAAARLAGWRGLLEQPPAGDVLIVTSNGAARLVLAAEPMLAQGLGLRKLRTGAYAEFARDRTGAWHRIAWDVRP